MTTLQFPGGDIVFLSELCCLTAFSEDEFAKAILQLEMLSHFLFGVSFYPLIDRSKVQSSILSAPILFGNSQNIGLINRENIVSYRFLRVQSTA